MLIEEGLFAFFQGQAAVAALIGQRFVPLSAAQGIGYPRVVYQAIGKPRRHTLRSRVTLVRARYQLDVQARGANGYPQARAVAKKIAAALPFRGNMGTIPVQGAYLLDENDSYDAPIHGDEMGVSFVSADLLVVYQENYET